MDFFFLIFRASESGYILFAINLFVLLFVYTSKHTGSLVQLETYLGYILNFWSVFFLQWLLLRYSKFNLEVIQAAIRIAKQESLFVSLDLASFEVSLSFSFSLDPIVALSCFQMIWLHQKKKQTTKQPITKQKEGVGFWCHKRWNFFFPLPFLAHPFVIKIVIWWLVPSCKLINSLSIILLV